MPCARIVCRKLWMTNSSDHFSFSRIYEVPIGAMAKFGRGVLAEILFGPATVRKTGLRNGSGLS